MNNKIKKLLTIILTCNLLLSFSCADDKKEERSDKEKIEKKAKNLFIKIITKRGELFYSTYRDEISECATNKFLDRLEKKCNYFNISFEKAKDCMLYYITGEDISNMIQECVKIQCDKGGKKTSKVFKYESCKNL